MRLRVTPSSAAAFEWQATEPQFRVGRGDGCALRFQGDIGATVSWEHAEFLLNSHGRAYVTDLRSSNGTYVDNTRIAAQTRLRVGSLVQLGKTGPQLEVLDLAPVQASAAQHATLETQAMAPDVARTSRSGDVQKSAETTNYSAMASTWFIRHIGAVSALIIIVTLAFFATHRSPPVPPPAKTSPPVVATVPTVARPAIETNKPDGPSTLPPAPSPTKAQEGRRDSNAEAQRPGLAAYRLIVVEDLKTQASWPFSGAVVIGEKSLLTTASVALELAKFVERGWRVSAMRVQDQTRTPITDLRVHAAYFHESAEDQLYFDMAVLFTAETVGRPITPASATELTALETGQPVVCLAIDHAGDPLDRFQQLEPQAYRGKILAVTSLPPQPGGPRLLHLRGTFTEKACGSPIFDTEGRLLAVYCEAAPASDTGQENLQLSYAKVIEPQLIELAVQGLDEKIWVRPPASAPLTSAPGPSK